MQHQQPGRVKHSAGHHNGRHGREQAPLPPTQPPGTPRQSQSVAAVGPSDQELIQSGIDPEAYCDLCQKEFCSKYFLRTHRQKIHGVSASKTDASYDHYRSMSQQATAAANPVLKMFPGLPLPTQTLFGSGPTGLLPSTPVVDPSPDPVISSQGRGNAKEAANATRVMCDICGKELCNKYFLKTHMAKIHGCTTASGGRTAELDVGETAPDTSEKRAPQESKDDHIPYGFPSYEKYPTASGSFANFTDHGTIPLLPGDNTLSHRPRSRNHFQENNDFQARDNTVSRLKTSPDRPRSTQAAVAGTEAVEHALENGERCLPETNDDRLARMDAERVSSNLESELSAELCAQYDVGREVRSEKRALTTNNDDDDTTTKRPRTDCFCDSSTPTVDTVATTHTDHLDTDDHDRPGDATANSGVIQFVSRSKDSTYRPTDNSDHLDDKMQTDSPWPGISDDVTEFSRSTNVKQLESNSLPKEGDYDGQWFTTVNGHADIPRETDSCSQAYVSNEQQHQQLPLMQPFIMRQEPLPSSRSSPGIEEAAGEPGDRTQFAACQLVLPVIKPIRDQVTVEFSVTPVSSD